MQVCTACMVVSLLTTCMNFNTPPLAQVAPFGRKIRDPNAEIPFNKEAEKARLPTASCLYNSKLAWTLGQLHLDHSRVSKRSPWLVSNHSMVFKKRLFSLSPCHPRASLGSNWALKVVRQVGATSQSSRNFALLPCCHDPFIVRSAPNLSTVPWFNSISASVSMFTIDTGNCLLSVSVSVLVSPSLHRVSVYIPRPLCSYRVCSSVPRSITVFVSLHLVVECGIHGLYITYLPI